MTEPCSLRSDAKGLGDDAAAPDALGLRLAHMKSWPGLLRVLGGLELLCGGMAFACVCADIPGADSVLLPGGAPLTPFVLAVAVLAWLLTAVLLGLGATACYRSVLLEAAWGPPTELGLNALLFLLYLAAAGVHVRTVTLGGLCSSPLPGGPLLTVLCRLDGGQVAALVFLFLTALLYLGSSVVALKMWRQQVARRHRDVPPPPVHAKRVAFKDELGTPQRPPGATITQKPGGASGCSALAGFVPQPCTIPDYVVRYPAIRSTQQRWQYGAVFTDQHAEFRQLLAQVRAQQGQRGQRGQREDALCRTARSALGSTDESRVARICRELLRKKRDAAFVAKQQRCLYLKAKLTHLKAQIQEYDRSARGSTVLF